MADEASAQYVVSTLKAGNALPATWPESGCLDVLRLAFSGRIITFEGRPLIPNWN